jgi:hypothetical protein
MKIHTYLFAAVCLVFATTLPVLCAQSPMPTESWNTPMSQDSNDYVAHPFLTLFPVVEILRAAERDEKPVNQVLGGLKFRMAKGMMLGIAVQKPVTERKDYSTRLMLGFDIER